MIYDDKDSDDDLLDGGYDDPDDYFCGHHVESSSLRIVEPTIPSELYHLEYLLKSYLSVAVANPERQRLSASFQLDQLARRMCGVLWDMRPKPDFYTVFEGNDTRHIAVDRTSATKAMQQLHQSILGDPKMSGLVGGVFAGDLSLLLPRHPKSYQRAEKLFIWKTGKLVKTYFTYKTINNGLRKGPEGLAIFRKRLATYVSVICIEARTTVQQTGWPLLAEAGLSEYAPHEDRLVSSHYVVVRGDREECRNGTAGDGRQHAFRFGATEPVSELNLLAHLRSLLEEDSPVCLVGHNLASIVEQLKGADLWFRSVPGRIDFYDTQALHLELTGRDRPAALESVVCDLFGKTPEGGLHNAGNRAHYTVCAMLKMAGIEYNI